MTILLGPVLTDAPTYKVKQKSSGKVLYKKQILPEGKFNYKGTELDLTAETLKGAVQSFKDGAFDEVPFQFGGKESEHNNDPFRRGGTLVHMEHVPGQGVNGFFDFSGSPEAAEYVEKYPKFGVSPRIVLDMDRADGKRFPVAIQHVCGTLVPRINGMGPWGKVELSDSDARSDEEVIDLSTETITAPPVSVGNGGGHSVIKVIPNADKDGENEVQLSQEQVDFINSLMKNTAEAEAFLSLGNDGVVKDKETPPVKVELPAEVTLSMGQIASHATEIAALKAQNVKAEWAAKRQALLSAGVPPHALDLATPVMERVESTVIELSTAEGTVQSSDKAQTLSLLETMKGTIDLGGEIGHQVGGKTPNADSDTQEEIDKWLSANLSN